MKFDGSYLCSTWYSWWRISQAFFAFVHWWALKNLYRQVLVGSSSKLLHPSFDDPWIIAFLQLLDLSNLLFQRIHLRHNPKDHKKGEQSSSLRTRNYSCFHQTWELEFVVHASHSSWFPMNSWLVDRRGSNTDLLGFRCKNIQLLNQQLFASLNNSWSTDLFFLLQNLEETKQREIVINFVCCVNKQILRANIFSFDILTYWYF